jgi:hypothetical protein
VSAPESETSVESYEEHWRRSSLRRDAGFEPSAQAAARLAGDLVGRRLRHRADARRLLRCPDELVDDRAVIVRSPCNGQLGRAEIDNRQVTTPGRE